MESEDINESFAEIIEFNNLNIEGIEINEDLDDPILDELNEFEIPAVVFIPMITDMGLMYSSLPISSKALETFINWYKTQE
jgi:hypothetical protein